MNKALGVIFFSILFFPSVLFAQNKFTRAADDAFIDQLYNLALTRYQKAFSKVKNNKGEKDRISFRIAECYRMMNITKKAEVAYKRLVNGKYVKNEPKVLLYYADMLKTNGNYDLAIVQYQAYKDKVPSDPKGGIGIETCNLAKEWMKNPTKYEVKWEKKINSKDDDFAPAYADKSLRSIIFTSDRAASTGKDIDQWTGLEFSDLFLARKDSKGDWNNPVPLDQGGTVNTKASEGAGTFNKRFIALYFTRCWNEEKKKNGCAIYKVSRTGATTWGEPEKLDLCKDSSKVVGHPSVNSEETALYFSSDLPGGHGGKDIWVVYKIGKSKSGAWGKPENLGPDINTAGDELFPFIRDDSILYFASNGLPGMGGLDIFRSVKRGDKWTKPENMRYPINSSFDDFGIVFSPEEEEAGYFSSNRPGGKGKDDIYSFVVPPLLFTLEGNITDDLSLQPVPGAKVRIVGTNGKSVEYTSDDRGHYTFNKNQIFPATTYELLVTKKDYFNEKGKETTVGLEHSKDLVRNFVLRHIPKKPVVLPDILYDLDKYDLKPQFQDSLQGLIETLDANENIVIELASHTDTRGSDERNDVLSQRRAQSVVDYLISRGIDPDRLVAKGYGKRVPRVLNKDITKDGFLFKAGTVITDSLIANFPTTPQKEAAHSLNRRTEFSILRNDYIPKTIHGKPVTPKIEVVQNPEEDNVEYAMTKEGNLEAACYLNGVTQSFQYDKGEKNAYISNALALQLLKQGLIDKNDFKGDVTKIIGEGTIADKSILVVRELRIGRNTVRNLEFTVSSRIKTTLLFGESTLSKFGAYTIDEKLGLIKFNE